jgi:pantoate--beta-alanine ligase
VDVEYLALADPQTFTEVEPGHRGPAVLLVAARVGTTRLIDNASLEIASVDKPAVQFGAGETGGPA